jgi:hypothetical protein
MENFTAVTGIAAPMLMPNINTDAISPMAAGRSTSTHFSVPTAASVSGFISSADVPWVERLE